MINEILLTKILVICALLFIVSLFITMILCGFNVIEPDISLKITALGYLIVMSIFLICLAIGIFTGGIEIK